MNRADAHVQDEAEPVLLERLFAEASAVPRDGRSAFLDRECAGDATLRSAVEALLVHSDECGQGFLCGAAVTAPPDESQFAPGHTIGGRYVIDCLLGEGGMGVVYLAEETEPLRRRVAIKVIRSSVCTRDTAIRFELERQTLALMSHANIASVYDAGMTPDGRPYLVMEYVEGRPITEFARNSRLGVDARLSLHLEVCEAVQHAHQKGVLHRDLKPSNVLVANRDGRPVVKVIDFGIAKAIDAGQRRYGDLTLESAFLGTPTYMSPEQFDNGADVDTRSDVYGLGALLYELLCGAPPFEAARLATVSLSDLLSIMRDEEPPRPSDRAASRPDASLLRGDLDWITTKAMAKERDRRYASAAALAEDIRRHRRHEPVEAGPPSATYRLGKFVRRRRGLVVASAVTTMALLTGAALAVWQARVALAEAETARLVMSVLQDMYRSIDPAVARGETVTVLDALNATAPQIDARFADRPTVLASLHWSIGGTYRALGEYVRAEHHLRSAISLLEEARGLDHRNTLQAWSDLAYLLKEAKRHDEAERIARQQLDRAIRVQGPHGEQTLALMTTLATALHAGKEVEESGRLFLATYEAYRAEFGERHRDTLMSMTNLAVWMMDSGRAAEAQPILERALTLYEDLNGVDHPVTVSTVCNLATVLTRQGHVAEALPHALRGHQDSTRVLGPHHPLTLARGRNLVVVLLRVARGAEAEVLAREMVDAARSKHGAAHPSTIASVEILVTAVGLNGRLEDAESIALRFFDDVEREAGCVDERTARVAQLLVELYDEWKNDDKKARWMGKKRTALAAEP